VSVNIFFVDLVLVVNLVMHARISGSNLARKCVGPLGLVLYVLLFARTKIYNIGLFWFASSLLFEASDGDA
jgi:hypothetical protein